MFENLKRKKVVLKSNEIKLEEIKLVANCYQRMFVSYILIGGGAYKIYSDLLSEVTVSDLEIENGIQERVKDRMIKRVRTDGEEKRMARRSR